MNASIAHKNQFVGDARSCLWLIETALLQLRHAPRDKEALDVAQGAANWGHENASIHGLPEFVRLFNAIETSLQHAIEQDLHHRGEYISLLLDITQHIDQLVDLLEIGLPPENHIHEAGKRLLDRLAGKTFPRTPSASPSIRRSTPQ